MAATTSGSSSARSKVAFIHAARDLCQSAIEHPGLAHAYFGSAPDDPELIARAEIVLVMLRRVGLTPIEAAAADTATSLLALARAQEDAVLHQRSIESGRSEQDRYGAIRTHLGEALPRDQYPAMNEMTDTLSPEHRGDVFNEMLSLILDGIDARLTRRAHPTTTET